MPIFITSLNPLTIPSMQKNNHDESNIQLAKFNQFLSKKRENNIMWGVWNIRSPTIKTKGDNDTNIQNISVGEIYTYQSLCDLLGVKCETSTNKKIELLEEFEKFNADLVETMKPILKATGLAQGKYAE